MTRVDCQLYGGVAQLARANGSYPLGRWFKSTRRYHFFNLFIPKIRPIGQAVKTSASHAGIKGSIPLWVTIFREFSSAGRASALQAEGHRFEPCNSHQNRQAVLRLPILLFHYLLFLFIIYSSLNFKIGNDLVKQQIITVKQELFCKLPSGGQSHLCT